MRILSWNVNGIRSVGRQGFLDWLTSESPDVLCVQETKALPEQLEEALLSPLGYQSFWHSAKKPGYSGVAIYAKCDQAPLSVREGVGVPEIDDEGRVLTAEFERFFLVNAYFPNSQREHTRLPYKLFFCSELHKFLDRVRRGGKEIILCGDYNIAHREIDLANPKTNVDNAGFLPEERAWMEGFLSSGWVDVFRRDHQDEPGHYSWWSYRPGVRDRNIGWRIDYHCVSEPLASDVKSSFLMPEVRGSDHCPVGIEL